ncbi:Protein of unknown function [Gryllus bimaculatus]|nr:Protein of unknown function [Gryllus bimaculatus]
MHHPRPAPAARAAAAALLLLLVQAGGVEEEEGSLEELFDSHAGAAPASPHEHDGEGPACDRDCDYRLADDGPSRPVEVVRYGQACVCKEPLPYHVEVPEPARPVVRGEYGYEVHTLPEPAPIQLKNFEFDVERTPEPEPCRTRDYAFAVHRVPEPPPVRLQNFAFDVQRPVEQKAPCVTRDLPYSVHAPPAPPPVTLHNEEFDVERPVKHRQDRLCGLTAAVDRMVIPAHDCPDSDPDAPCDRVICRHHARYDSGHAPHPGHPRVRRSPLPEATAFPNRAHRSTATEDVTLRESFRDVVHALGKSGRPSSAASERQAAAHAKREEETDGFEERKVERVEISQHNGEKRVEEVESKDIVKITHESHDMSVVSLENDSIDTEVVDETSSTERTKIVNSESSSTVETVSKITDASVTKTLKDEGVEVDDKANVETEKRYNEGEEVQESDEAETMTNKEVDSNKKGTDYIKNIDEGSSETVEKQVKSVAENEGTIAKQLESKNTQVVTMQHKINEGNGAIGVVQEGHDAESRLHGATQEDEGTFVAKENVNARKAPVEIVTFVGGEAPRSPTVLEAERLLDRDTNSPVHADGHGGDDAREFALRKRSSAPGGDGGEDGDEDGGGEKAPNEEGGPALEPYPAPAATEHGLEATSTGDKASYTPAGDQVDEGADDSAIGGSDGSAKDETVNHEVVKTEEAETADTTGEGSTVASTVTTFDSGSYRPSSRSSEYKEQDAADGAGSNTGYSHSETSASGYGSNSESSYQSDPPGTYTVTTKTYSPTGGYTVTKETTVRSAPGYGEKPAEVSTQYHTGKGKTSYVGGSGAGYSDSQAISSDSKIVTSYVAPAASYQTDKGSYTITKVTEESSAYFPSSDYMSKETQYIHSSPGYGPVVTNEPGCLPVPPKKPGYVFSPPGYVTISPEGPSTHGYLPVRPKGTGYMTSPPGYFPTQSKDNSYLPYPSGYFPAPSKDSSYLPSSSEYFPTPSKDSSYLPSRPGYLSVPPQGSDYAQIPEVGGGKKGSYIVEKVTYGGDKSHQYGTSTSEYVKPSKKSSYGFKLASGYNILGETRTGGSKYEADLSYEGVGSYEEKSDYHGLQKGSLYSNDLVVPIKKIIKDYEKEQEKITHGTGYETTETSGMQVTDGYHGLVVPADKVDYKEKVTTYSPGTMYNTPTSYTSTPSHKGSKGGKEYGKLKKGYADISYGPTHSSEYVYDAQLLKATKGYVRRIGDIPLKDDKTVEDSTYNLKHLKGGDIHSTWYEATPIKYGLVKGSGSGYQTTETGYKTGTDYGIMNGGKYVSESSGYKTSKQQPPKGYGTGYTTSKKYTTDTVYGPSGSSYIPILDNTETAYIPPTGPGYVPIYGETTYSLNDNNSYNKKKKTDIKTMKGYATDYSGSAVYGSGDSYNVVSGYAASTKHDSKKVKKGYSGYGVTGSRYVSGTKETEGQVSGSHDLESYPSGSGTGSAYLIDQQYSSKNKKGQVSSYGVDTDTSYGTQVMDSGYGKDATYDSLTYKGKSTGYSKGSDSTYVSGKGYGVVDSGYGSSKKIIKKTETKYVSGKYASGYGLDGNAIESGYSSGHKTYTKKDGIYGDSTAATYGVGGTYGTSGSGYEPSTGYESSNTYYGDYSGKGSYISGNNYAGQGYITSSTHPPSSKGNSSYGTSGASTYSSESTYGSEGSGYPSPPGYAVTSHGAVVSKNPQSEYGVAAQGYEATDLTAASGTVHQVTPSCTSWASPAKTVVIESSPGAGKCGCENGISDEGQVDGKGSVGQRFRRRGYMCLPLKKLLPVLEGA